MNCAAIAAGDQRLVQDKKFIVPDGHVQGKVRGIVNCKKKISSCCINFDAVVKLVNDIDVFGFRIDSDVGGAFEFVGALTKKTCR